MEEAVCIAEEGVVKQRADGSPPGRAGGEVPEGASCVMSTDYRWSQLTMIPLMISLTLHTR